MRAARPGDINQFSGLSRLPAAVAEVVDVLGDQVDVAAMLFRGNDIETLRESVVLPENTSNLFPGAGPPETEDFNEGTS